jgi:hypothetical protein
MMKAVNPKFAKFWRCIRILAEIDDPMNAPTPDFGFQEGEVMREIGPQEYQDLFAAFTLELAGRRPVAGACVSRASVPEAAISARWNRSPTSGLAT